MRDRAALILKVVCVCLAAWLALELVRVGKDANPLARVTMPDVPTLPADTNAPPPVANKPPAKPGTNAIAGGTNAITSSTNAMAAVTDTNGAAVVADTNAAPHKKARGAKMNTTAVADTSVSTNSAASTNVAAATNVTAATNIVINSSTNSDVVAVVGGSVQSNASAAVVSGASPTNAVGSNTVVASPTSVFAPGTNLVGSSTGTNSTNAATAKVPRARPPNAAIAGMPGGPGGKKASALAPEIQARVDRVYESEIFAPIMHPMPMALMGIAGNVAFLRAPNGQTGMVKEGDDLGDVKLLRIGTNRVLVEQDGKKQELMIFAGLGGESLLSKTNDSSNETTKH